MSICTWIVVPITFQQVNHAPNAEAGAEGNNQRLQYIDCRIEKFHRKTRGRAVNEHRPQAQPRPPSIVFNESNRYFLGFLGFVRFLWLHLRRLNLHRLSRRRRTPPQP